MPDTWHGITQQATQLYIDNLTGKIVTDANGRLSYVANREDRTQYRRYIKLILWIVLLILVTAKFDVSLVVRKSAFCICENKDADQLRGDREADQRLCFRYTDSTVPLLPKSEIANL